MEPIDLKERTKKFGIRVMKLVNALPAQRSADVIGKQLIRSATSVGANYRAACRSRSRAEFIAKLGIVEEEVDESGYWLEMIVESGMMKRERVKELIDETNELTAIIVASIRTARGGSRNNIRTKKENRNRSMCYSG